MAGEEQYRRLFEEATEGICLADRDTGIIQDCNRAFLQLTGYERSELIGKPQSILHPAEGIRPPHSKTFLLHRSEKQGEILHDFLVTKSGAIKEVEIKGGPIELGGRSLIHGFFRDTTEETRARHERKTSLALMRLLNDRNNTRELIRSLTEFLHEWTGCEAVGIRLRDGDDFPYFETRGFPGEFVELENFLCARDLEGQILRDEIGNPVLECMCGNVLCGRFDPKLPFFTEKGSFWSNCTTELLATTTEAERQTRTRNRCNMAGYESVAIIPLKYRNRILGLMQLNGSARGKFTPELIAFLENTADQIAIALDQRQTQSALEASEERYRRLFEVETDTIFLVDAKSLRYIDVNAAAVKLYGYSRKEFLGMKADDVSTDPEGTRKSITTGETFVPLRWHRKKDGTVFPVEISICSFENCGRKIYVAAIRDITERRQMEEEMLFKNALLLTQQETTIDGILAVDANDNVILRNHRFNEMWNIPTELQELRNDAPILETVCRKVADSDAFLEKVRYLYDHRQENSRDEILLADGRTFDRYSSPLFGADGRYFGRIWYFRDISERKRAEGAIRESQRQNEFLAKIIEYSSQPFVMGYPDGRIGLYNTAFEAMLGYGKDELKNSEWLNGLTPPEWKEFSLQKLEELQRSGTSIRYEKEYFRKDGSRIPVEAYVHAVPDSTGDSLCYYAFITDISERKRVEEEKRKMALAIQEERDRLSALVNSIDEEVWFTDNNKRIVLVNPSACKAFGLKSAENIEVEKLAASLEIFRPDGTPRPLEETTPLIALQGKTVRNKEELVRVPSTGELRHREVTSAPVLDGDGKIIGSVSVVRDITEYKRLEKSRLDNEQKYRSLFENSMDAVFLGKPDGTIFSANRAACSMFGLSEEEICRAGRYALLDTSDLRFPAAQQERTRTGKVQSELTCIRGDGTKFPVELTSVLLEEGALCYVMIRDLTERKRSESLLLQAYERLDLAKKATGGGIWDWNLKTNELDWSPELFAIYGFDPKQTQSSLAAWHSIMHPADRDAIDELVRRNIEDRKTVHTSECRIVRPDGQMRWLITMAYITYENDAPVRMTGLCHDITDRKNAETALRESEERYRGLFENLTEAYAYHRMIFENGEPTDYVFLAVNESFEKMTGLKDVLGKRVTEVIPSIRESDSEWFSIYGRVATTGKPEKFEKFVESMKMWFHVSVYSPEKGFFVTVFDNITDRKNSEIKLQKSEELFSKAFHNSPVTMTITSRIDRRFIDVNEAFERTTGYSREDVVGRKIGDLGLWDKPEGMERAVKTVDDAGRYRGMEFDFRVRSGEVRTGRVSAETIEIDGEPCVLATAEDISDWKKAEIAVRKSEELFSKAFHGSPITMVITSLADNRIIDVNKTFEESTEYSREEVLGRDFRNIGLWMDPEGAEACLQAVLADGQYRGLEFDFRTKSGKHRTGRLSAEMVEVGGETCIFTVAEDITDRKKAELALKKSEELFSKAFHASPMSMAIFSLSDQRMLDVNEAFLRQAGYTREEVIGRTPLESMVMIDREKLEGMTRNLLENGFIHGQECPYRTRSGEQRIGYFSAEIAEIGGSPCILLVADDITDRKRAAEALKESNRIQSELLAKLNEAQKIAAVGSWEWNLSTDRVWWSDETYRIFGFEPGDFTPSFEANAQFIHPDDLGIYRDSFERSLQTNDPLVIDVRLIANGGALKYCHAKGEIIRDDSGQLGRFSGTIMDVTEKKRAEEALRANEERFRLLFENMSSGLAIYEAVNGGTDFVIRELNPAAERICRTTRKEAVGRKVTELFPGTADIGLMVAFRRVWEKGFPERIPASSYHDERLSLWVDNFVFKLPTGEVVAIFDDITERKLAEIELRRNEIWYRSLIELGVSVYTVVDAKRQIHYVSPIARKIFGWNPEDYFRKSFFDFVIPDDLEEVSRFFAELLSVPGRKKRLLTKMLCKDGSYKVMELFGVNLIDEPAVQGIVLSSHDITEQVKSRERLDAIRAELNHATRLASMGALSAGIAHEINQPLSIMATWAEVAMREIREKLTGDSEEALFALKRIDSALQRSGEIVRRMKDFARRSEPRVSTVNLSEAIDEVYLLLGHQLREAGVEISVEMDCELPSTFADRVQVHQVLMNLILNALEAMQNVEPQGRKVTITAKVREGELEVAVSDTGCGIPPDRLENVFDPFHSTKAEGLGLGLSICRSIIEWHSGRIWAARNPDRGTTITFTLPIVKEKLRHATENNHFYRR